jgi:hypothetical protein
MEKLVCATVNGGKGGQRESFRAYQGTILGSTSYPKGEEGTRMSSKLDAAGTYLPLLPPRKPKKKKKKTESTRTSFQ